MHPRVQTSQGFADRTIRHLARQVGVHRNLLPRPPDHATGPNVGHSSDGPVDTRFLRSSGATLLHPPPAAGAAAAQVPTGDALRYDSAADPAPFLQAYEEAVWAAGRDDKVKANWLPMAL